MCATSADTMLRFLPPAGNPLTLRDTLRALAACIRLPILAPDERTRAAALRHLRLAGIGASAFYPVVCAFLALLRTWRKMPRTVPMLKR